MNTLSITNRTLTLGSTVYQVSNITSIGKYRIKPIYVFKIRFIVGCGVLSLLGFHFFRINSNPTLKWFSIIVVSIFAIGVLERFIKSKKYGLSIETNSGSARLIASKNERLIDDIISRTVEIMNNKDMPAQYTFNVSDGDIINQSGRFETGVKVG